MARARRKTAPNEASSRAKPGLLEGGKAKLDNWADQKESEPYKEAARLLPIIERAYDNREEADKQIEEFWHIFNCQPDENQVYQGNSQCYVPAVRDCISARAKRCVKQLFPVSYRHIEAVGADATQPYPQLSLLEHYIRKLRLKDVVRSDLIAGDVTGQWNLYVDWTKSYRRITEVVRGNPIMELTAPLSREAIEVGDPTSEEDSEQDSDILEEGPVVVDFATEDLAVVPPTVNDLEEAEVAALKLRMSKDKVRQMVDEGVFILPEKGRVENWVEGKLKGDDRSRSPQKQRAEEAGIKIEGTTTYALVYEATPRLDFGDGVKRLAYVYYCGDEILGIIKAPQWGGKRPVLSRAAERVRGSFHGISKIEPVKFLQWNLNDYWNMGQDSAMYTLLPIWAADPIKNPNWAAMVMGLAAVWPIAPNDIAPITEPQLYKEALMLCDAIERRIWQSMDVNELMMGKMPPGRKNNQMIGGVQQSEMMAIMDHAERYEEVMLNPLVERLFEYDRQFRTTKLTVLTKGEVGFKAKMTDVEPQQFGERYHFQWAGTSYVQGLQRMQVQISTMNVLRGVPPQQLGGRRLDVSPIIERLVENVFGPELTPRILIDDRNLFTIPAMVEDEMLLNGIPVDVHQADDDIQHLVQHQQSAKVTGDLSGAFRTHMAAHMMQLQAKRQQQMAMMAQGQPGVPGAPGPSVGGAASPGMAGTPRIGATPGAPRGGQGPAGTIHADNMADGQMPGRG